jgi:hypothetical protein
MSSLEKPLSPIEQILVNEGVMRKTLENIEKNSMKQFAALIGVIMALIGSKLISTPWYVDVCVILCLVSGTFLVVLLVVWWKFYSLPQKATRISGCLLMLSSSICQIWVYQPGETPAPVWFVPLINITMVFLAVSLIWAGWKQLPKRKL